VGQARLYRKKTDPPGWVHYRLQADEEIRWADSGNYN
jgi:hypothetical protein